MRGVRAFLGRGEALWARLRGRTPGRRWIRQYQDRALRRIVAHAYENVPYYRRLFDSHGVKPSHVRTVSDLLRIPITTRDDLRLAPFEDVVARGTRRERLVVHRTSGTTGMPFNVLRSGFEHQVTRLTWLRVTRCYGVRLRDRVASVVYMERGPAPDRLRFQQLRHRLRLGSHLSVDLCLQPEEIARILSGYRPDFLSGYAATLALVAASVSRLDLPPIRPRAVYLGGEVLTDRARRQVREAFECPVYNCYASEEFGLMAWECPETGSLHTHDDSMILEVLRGGRPAGPGERGEVVGTNLFAYAMPIIRYRMADVVTRGARQCPCGAPFATIRSIQGRVMDYLHLPGGRVLHPYDIVRTMYRAAPWVLYQQIVQERLDRIVLRVVASGDPSRAEVRALQEAMAELAGPGIGFEVVRVPELSPLPNGKFQYSYSMVDRGD